MPYLTPDAIPEDAICRPLFIPDDTSWLAIVSGALTELTKVWNWEQFGTLTPEQCVERMQLMIADYYADTCGTCDQPDGDPWVQLDELGRWRMFDGAAWQEPTGDYEIPSQTARTEATAAERKCLAAKNAVNVLAVLYEEVSDAAESGLQAAEYLVDFALLIGLAIAGPIGLLAKAALTIAVFAYKEFFNFSDFLTEDFWTSEFTEKLVCIFQIHATDAAGVVSFDFDAIYADIFATQQFDLVVQGLRLAGQVQYLMRVVGAEGINLAGETTAITDDDCSSCDNWGYIWDFGVSEGDTDFDSSIAYVGGHWNTIEWAPDLTGHSCATVGNYYDLGRRTQPFDIPSGTVIEKIIMNHTVQDGNVCNHLEMWIGTDRSAGLAETLRIYTVGAAGNPSEVTGSIAGPASGVVVGFGTNSYDGTTGIQSLRVEGSGPIPDFTGGSAYIP